MSETLDSRFHAVRGRRAGTIGTGATKDWRRRMSDNVATALIAYTGLQIYVTVQALKKGFGPALSYMALILLIAAIIPACRRFERRWLTISDAAAHDPALRGLFRRDQALLWALTIGTPFAVTALGKALLAAG